MDGVWVLQIGNVFNRVTNSNTYKIQVVYMRKEVQGHRETRGRWKRGEGVSPNRGGVAAQLHLLVARGERVDPGLPVLCKKKKPRNPKKFE